MSSLSILLLKSKTDFPKNNCIQQKRQINSMSNPLETFIKAPFTRYRIRLSTARNYIGMAIRLHGEACPSGIKPRRLRIRYEMNKLPCKRLNTACFQYGSTKMLCVVVRGNYNVLNKSAPILVHQSFHQSSHFFRKIIKGWKPILER